MMSGNALLSFGVEVEMILTPQAPQPSMTRYDLATMIAEFHNAEFNTNSDLKMLAVGDESETVLKDRGYKEWGLLYDGTIIVDKHGENFGMELTSPILDFDHRGEWRDHIRKAFRSVEAVAQITTNISCGTHVHFSPGRGKHWTHEELQEISHAIIFFEGALLKLVPESRRDCVSCYSNGYRTGLAAKEPAECWKQISAFTPDTFVELMSPYERFYSWNFFNLSKHPYEEGHWNGYTIEWRLPPGVTTTEACLMWVELGLNFIKAARQLGTHDMLMDKKKRTVEYLKQFIKRSMDERASNERYLEPAFVDKSGRSEPTDWNTDRHSTDKHEEDQRQQAMLQELRREDNSWG